MILTNELIKTKHTYEDGSYFEIMHEEKAVNIYMGKWGFHDECVLFEEILSSSLGPDLLIVTPEDVHKWIEENEDTFIPRSEPAVYYCYSNGPNREIITES